MIDRDAFDDEQTALFERYTEGRCHELALVLADELPALRLAIVWFWPEVIIDDPADDENLHVLVYDPGSGIAFDAAGARSLDEIREEHSTDGYETEVEDASAERVLGLCLGGQRILRAPTGAWQLEARAAIARLGLDAELAAHGHARRPAPRLGPLGDDGGARASRLAYERIDLAH